MHHDTSIFRNSDSQDKMSSEIVHDSTSPTGFMGREESMAMTLPSLDRSDAWLREVLIEQIDAETNAHSLFGILISDGLVRKAVLILNGIDEGYLPRRWLKSLQPQQAFVATPIIQEELRVDHEPLYKLDSANFDRYQQWINAIDSLSTNQWFSIYCWVKPLLGDAYLEIGLDNEDIDDRMFRVMNKIVQSPVIEAPVLLTRPTVTYRYVDQELERLSDFQKQLIRIGPQNTRRIQRKATEFIELMKNSKDIANLN